MSKTLKWTSIAVAAVLLGTFLIRALGQNRSDPPGQNDDDTIQAPSLVVVENGAAMVKLGARAQQRAGITLATLQKARSRQDVTAPATVLATDALATLRGQYVADQDQVKKAEIAAGVVQPEYQRLKNLYAQDQNVSAKALQAAQGQLQADHADLTTARQRLELDRAGVRQNWGGVVSEWVASGAPSLDRVLNQQDVLVEVTIPAGQPLTTPRSVRLEIPAGGSVAANFVSAFPRTDPRIQGVSLLYLAAERPGLVPGVNPVAHFAVGKVECGVVVPQSAVVWWQGNAWVYRETGAGEFTRTVVPAGAAAGGGYFVARGLASGDRIVVRGAQTLLSEEFRSQIQPED
jgi:hypothetical protein